MKVDCEAKERHPQGRSGFMITFRARRIIIIILSIVIMCTRTVAVSVRPWRCAAHWLAFSRADLQMESARTAAVGKAGQPTAGACVCPVRSPRTNELVFGLRSSMVRKGSEHV